MLFRKGWLSNKCITALQAIKILGLKMPVILINIEVAIGIGLETYERT